MSQLWTGTAYRLGAGSGDDEDVPAGQASPRSPAVASSALEPISDEVVRAAIPAEFDCLIPPNIAGDQQLIAEVTKLHECTAAWILEEVAVDAATKTLIDDLMVDLVILLHHMENTFDVWQ